jgi:hypothetical protein
MSASTPGELGTVAALPGGQQHGEGFLALLAAKVQLGGPAAPGPAQRVVGRFGQSGL